MALTEKRTVHEKPVSGQHPDEHQHNGQGERQEFSQSEPSTAAKWNPVLKKVRDALWATKAFTVYRRAASYC